MSDTESRRMVCTPCWQRGLEVLSWRLERALGAERIARRHRAERLRLAKEQDLVPEARMTDYRVGSGVSTRAEVTFDDDAKMAERVNSLRGPRYWEDD